LGLIALRMPITVQHIGAVRYIHSVNAIRQPRESVITAAIRGGGSYQVSICVVEVHGHPVKNAGFSDRFQRAVGIGVMPERARDGVGLTAV